MAPIFAGLINLIPGVINSVGHLIKDKKRAKEETSKILPAFTKDIDNIADGIELSSKTIFGYGLSGVVIMAGLKMVVVSATATTGLWVLGIGALIAVGTTIAKALEK